MWLNRNKYRSQLQDQELLSDRTERDEIAEKVSREKILGWKMEIGHLIEMTSIFSKIAWLLAQ